MPAHDHLITRERAIQIARDGIRGIGNGTIEDIALDPDQPAWVVTAMKEEGSESPFLANTTIRVRQRLRIDALTGQVLSREVLGNPEYIRDGGHPSRWVTTVWRHVLEHGGITHDVVIYSVRVPPPPGIWRPRRHSVTAYEALVDGEWPSPSGHAWYRTYDEALAAAQEAVAARHTGTS